MISILYYNLLLLGSAGIYFLIRINRAAETAKSVNFTSKAFENPYPLFQAWAKNRVFDLGLEVANQGPFLVKLSLGP